MHVKLKKTTMQKTILLLTLIIASALTYAQGPVVTITSPTGLTEPYLACLNASFTLEADTSGIENWMWDDGWYTCTEMPDFDGYSNYSKWVSTQVFTLTYTTEITEEVYLWFKSNVSGGMIGSTPVFSNVIHIDLKGDKPELVYTETTFCEGGSLPISSSIDNLGDGKYKWFKDGVEIAGATNALYDIAEEGSYYVGALTNETNCPGIYYTSDSASFNFIKPTVSGSFKPDLNRVTLETSMATSHQWYQASSTTSTLINIDGAINNTYNATVSTTDMYYAVEIETASGCVANSDRVLINDSLYSVPEIIEPTDTFGCRDENILLSLKNEGYATYQWYKNGSSIYNATNSTFNAGANYPGGTGSYSVKVTTELDPTTEYESNAINLAFGVQPNIGIKDDAKPCPGGKITLEAKPGFNGEVGGYDTYQWYFNDANDISSAVEITGATDSVVEIDVPTETRYYWIKTTLNGCEDESYGKRIEEFSLYAPYIRKNPYDGLICLGDTIILSSSARDVTFQWYFNDEMIEGATENEYKAAEVGFYDLEIASTLCASAAPIMNKDSAVIQYRFNPAFSVYPDGTLWNGNPNHQVFCGGDTISLQVDNASNYSTWQWMGKLFDVNSSSDEWEDVDGESDSVYTFINGQNNKLRFKVRVDSVMANDEVCSAMSDYKIIDQHVNQNPAISSFGNSELCDAGDSTLIHLAFPGDWDHMEWYLDGELVPNTNTDSIYAKETGMWTITCYPNTCPNIPHSSGIGPTVKFMPEAEIWENDTVIYAMPELGYYFYQWYFNDQAIDMDTIDLPWVLYKKDLVPGSYTVEVSNPAKCIRLSSAYVVEGVGINDELTKAVNIYPNPVNSELNITISDIENTISIEIYNSTGALVEKVNVDQNNTILSMTDKISGIYLVKVNYTNKQSSIHKVVKQ